MCSKDDNHLILIDSLSTFIVEMDLQQRRIKQLRTQFTVPPTFNGELGNLTSQMIALPSLDKCPYARPNNNSNDTGSTLPEYLLVDTISGSIHSMTKLNNTDVMESHESKIESSPTTSNAEHVAPVTVQQDYIITPICGGSVYPLSVTGSEVDPNCPVNGFDCVKRPCSAKDADFHDIRWMDIDPFTGTIFIAAGKNIQMLFNANNPIDWKNGTVHYFAGEAERNFTDAGLKDKYFEEKAFKFTYADGCMKTYSHDNINELSLGTICTVQRIHISRRQRKQPCMWILDSLPYASSPERTFHMDHWHVFHDLKSSVEYPRFIRKISVDIDNTLHTTKILRDPQWEFNKFAF